MKKQHQFELKPMSSNFHFSITSQQGVEISTKYTIIPRTNTDKMTAPSTEIQLIQLLLLKFLGECSLLDFPSQRAVFRGTLISEFVVQRNVDNDEKVE